MREIPEDLQQKANEILANIPDSTPGCRLMLCVLEEAIITFMRGVASPRSEQQRHYHEVVRWMRSDEDAWPFAFRNICNALQIDPEHIRSHLKQYADEHAPPMPTPPTTSCSKSRKHR